MFGIFSEPGISGSVPFAASEQGAALLATARKGDVIVCLKLDRAFRDSPDALGTLEALQKRGIGLYRKPMIAPTAASTSIWGKGRRYLIMTTAPQKVSPRAERRNQRLELQTWSL